MSNKINVADVLERARGVGIVFACFVVSSSAGAPGSGITFFTIFSYQQREGERN